MNPQPPASVLYPFSAAESLFEPPPEYRQLQEISPIHRIVFRDTGKEAWLATGYEVVRTVLTDPIFSRAAAAKSSSLRTGIGELAAESLLGLDPPEHTRLRRVITSAFTRHQAELLRPRVRDIADGLVERMFASSTPVDLVSSFAFPFPIIVICELLGIPAGDMALFNSASDILVSGWARDPVEVEKAFSDLRAYFADLISIKRVDPRDDLITKLITARDSTDEPLSADEVFTMAITLLVAGHETCSSFLSLIFLMLLEHPDDLHRLRSTPEILPSAVEELLRFIPISDGAGAMARIALADLELGGQHIAAGEAVIPAIPAANRDPAVFSEPDVLNFTRIRTRHLSFGAGFHHCVGSSLARVELQEALRALLERLPTGLHVPLDRSALECKTLVSLRSLREVPLTW